MRNLAWVVCALLLGCGSGSGGGGGTGGTGGGGAGGGGGGGTAGSGGGGGGSGGAQVAVTGKIVSSGGGMGSMTGPVPISGATVTITGTQTSATTAADGAFSLMAAAGSTIFLTVTKSTYQSSEVGYVVPASGGAVADITLLLNSEVSAAVGALSPALTVDPSKAAVVVQFYDQSQTAGYGATLSAAHDNSFNPETGSYANTTAGGKNKQTLVFPNVVTGTTTVTATTPQGKTCTPQQAITNWRADAGVFTWVSFNCQ